MPYYEEEIARAREIDLLTYLHRCEPNEFVRGSAKSTSKHIGLFK